MSSDRFDDQSQLPVWLRNVPLPPRPDMPLPSSEVVSDSARADAELPPWLREEEDTSSAAEEHQALPAWLSSEPSASTPAKSETPAPRPHTQGFTGWLSSIDTPTPSDTTSEMVELQQEQSKFPNDSDASSDEMPDWLRQLSGEVAAAPPTTPAAPTAESDWLSLNITDEVAPENAPSWLTEDVAPAQPATDAPSWLTEDTPQLPSPGPATDIPSWLAENTASSDQQSWLASESLQESPKNEALDWFSHNAPEAESSSSPPWLDQSAPVADDDLQFKPFSFDQEPAEQAASSPAWLDQSAPAQPASDMADNDLQFKPFSFDDDSEPSTASSMEPPPWLSTDTGSAQDDTELDAPAWLRIDEPVASPSEADLDTPAWLRTEPPQTAVPTPAQDSPAWSQLDQTGTADQALPTWLTDDSTAGQMPTDESMPAWLQQEPASAPALPDWLADEQVPVTGIVAPDSSDADSAAIPDWLHEADVPQAAPNPELPPAPDWLREADVPAVELGLVALPADEEVPTWLRDTALSSTPDFTVSDVPESFVEAAQDQPPWLAESLSTVDTTLHLPSKQPTDEDQPQADIAAWLSTSEPSQANTASTPAKSTDDALPPWLKDERGEPLPSAMAPGDSNLPAWLRGMQDQHGIQAEPPVSPEPALEAPKQAKEELSFDWFDDQPANQPAARATARPDENLLGGAELPAWLHTDTEKSGEKTKEPVEGRSLDWLSRIGGADEEEQLIAGPAPQLSPIPLPTRTPAQLEAIALMRALSAQPYPEPISVVEEQQSGMLQQMGIGRILSILLLVALIVAIAVPSLSVPFQATGNVSGAAPLLEQIQQLGENDTVLLGYEWDAQRISEMRPLERAVIGQLIEQGVKLILVSTDPQASLLQYDLREQMTLNNYQGGGSDYILLGYRPGGDIALRSMAQDFRNVLRSDFQGLDATVGQLATKLENSEPRISTLSDLSMVIVLADEPADVQGWMEQIYPTLGKPIGFLIPAGLQPVAQPYFQQQNVYAVTGTRGALAYEQLRGGVVGAETTRSAGQVNLATVIFAVLLLISALGVFIVQFSRRRNTA